MPDLVFDLGGKEISCGMTKVDRAKLYGYVDTQVLDDRDRECELATLAGDGKTLIPMGGTAFAYLSPDGLWRNKTDLKPVNLNGEPIAPVVSSFKAPIHLSEKVSIDEYLSHNIRIVYRLHSEAGLGEIEQAIGDDDTVFAFDFSYRGGLVADRAFLLKGQDGAIWMAVGKATKISFIGMQQQAVIEDEVGPDEEEADLDFGMM
ncbi:MAG: hypothetical protein R3F19_20170 [Verrucomicrobiales bacterium]